MMTKRKLAKPSPEQISNGHTNHHPGKLNGKVHGISSLSSSLQSWLTPTTLLKTALLVAIAAVGPVIVLKDFGFTGRTETIHEKSPSSATSWSYSPGPAALSPKEIPPNGGWGLADAEAEAKLGSDFCNIERVSVLDLNPERFEREFRYKKPVLVSFPNGASDWTDPYMWSLDYLNRSYGEWVMSSGNSFDIIRRGGNGHVSTKFSQFLERISQQKNSTSGLPMYYIFDRDFYYDSDLPSTFHLPPYFSNDEKLQDSIFFLGASGSGVVFHKHADTWNAVVFGKKRWFLYPMRHTPPGGVYHGYTLMDWYGRIYPNLTEKNRPLECTQEAGEILYLPEGFYHATLNIGDTIAVALQTKEAVLPEEKLTYEVTNLVNLLGKSESNDKAINEKILNKFLKLLSLMPENAEVNMKLGEKYGDLGQHEPAVKYLQKAIDLDPYFVLAFARLGAGLSSLKRDQEAEAALKHALELSPGIWDIYKDYSMFLLYKGRYAEAVPILKKGAELNPDIMPFWTYLKEAQEQSGDLEGAKQTQRKIDEMNHNQENTN